MFQPCPSCCQKRSLVAAALPFLGNRAIRADSRTGCAGGRVRVGVALAQLSRVRGPFLLVVLVIARVVGVALQLEVEVVVVGLCTAAVVDLHCTGAAGLHTAIAGLYPASAVGAATAVHGGKHSEEMIATTRCAEFVAGAAVGTMAMEPFAAVAARSTASSANSRSFRAPSRPLAKESSSLIASASS